MYGICNVTKTRIRFVSVSVGGCEWNVKGRLDGWMDGWMVVSACGKYLTVEYSFVVCYSIV